jgi:hypothetical protein
MQIINLDNNSQGEIIVCEQMVNASLDVDIKILLNISTMMTNFYVKIFSHSPIIRDNKIFPHLERSLDILRPWKVIVDFDANHQSNSLNSRQIDYLLGKLFHIERNMASVTINRNQFDVAEGHCHRCLPSARRLGVEGEDKG